MRWNIVLGYCNWQRMSSDIFWETECGNFYRVDGDLKFDYCPFCKTKIATYVSYIDTSKINCNVIW